MLVTPMRLLAIDTATPRPSLALVVDGPEPWTVELPQKGAEALAAYEPVLARAANLPDTGSGAAARAGEADSAGEAGSDGEADAAGETGSTGDEDPVGDADPVAKGTVPLAYRTEKP